MAVQRFNNVIGLSRRYLVDPHGLDDICYALFKMFKDESVSIVYEKPICSHIFVIGSNFEIRLFINTSYELHLSIIFDSVNSLSTSTLRFIQDIFHNLDKTFSKFCKSFGDIQLSLRSTFKIDHINMDKLMKSLSSLGVVIETKEKHHIDNITIVVIRGKTVGKHLKMYNIMVTLLYDDISEVTFTIDSEVKTDDDIVLWVVDIQNFLYNTIEHLFNYTKNGIYTLT
ncbi:MAG: hypothetical protein QW101_07400 [Ignisphaera sp.]|uniref:Uncharacterized protein n=1 Tax=Ignisphaera aggregans TaxID=334771 RepID=A0A7J3MYF8_9CREN